MTTKHLLAVTHPRPDRWIARSLQWPEVSGEADSEVEAVAQARGKIGRLLGEAKIVEVEVSAAGEAENPWVAYAGWCADDPTYEMYLEELAAARRRDDLP